MIAALSAPASLPANFQFSLPRTCLSSISIRCCLRQRREPRLKGCVRVSGEVRRRLAGKSLSLVIAHPRNGYTFDPNILRASRHPPVVVMKPSQYWSCDDSRSGVGLDP